MRSLGISPILYLFHLTFSLIHPLFPFLAPPVSTLHQHLDVPVTAKFRKQATMDKTVGMAAMLQEAGAQVLCMHGRLREQRGTLSGKADWDSIKLTRYESAWRGGRRRRGKRRRRIWEGEEVHQYIEDYFFFLPSFSFIHSLFLFVFFSLLLQ